MPKLKVSPYDALIILNIHFSCSMKLQPSSNICTRLVIAIVLPIIPDIFSSKCRLHNVVCQSTVPGETSQSRNTVPSQAGPANPVYGLWLGLRWEGLTSPFMFVFISLDDYVSKNEKKKMMGVENRSVQQWLKSSRDHLTGWKWSWWDMKHPERSQYYTWWFCVLSTFS